MDRALMADSISHLPEFRSWHSIIRDTLAEFDLNNLLVYIIDSVDKSALPALAAQFDVLGYKGYRMAATEAEQRALLKRAIELHRFKGTEWAIVEALRSIGFEGIELIKGYDHWAKFGIAITNKNLQLTDASFQDILRMVAEYKRAVCVLVEVKITILTEDTLTISDEDAFISQEISTIDNLLLSGAIRFNGEINFDGSNNYSGDSDSADMNEN